MIGTKKNSFAILILVVGIFSLSACASADKRHADKPMDPDRLQKLEVRRKGPDYIVRITGKYKPTYTVFRLQNPPRIVVDLANYDVRPLQKPKTIDKGDIARIRARQFGDQYLSLGRFEITLRTLADFNTWTEGNAVLIRVQPAQAKLDKTIALTQTDDATMLNEPVKNDEVLLQEEFLQEDLDNIVLPEGEATQAQPTQKQSDSSKSVQAAPANNSTQEENVIGPEGNEDTLPAVVEETEPSDKKAGKDKKETKKAQKAVQADQLMDLTWVTKPDLTTLTIEANGPIGDFNTFKLEDPARIVIDIWNVASLLSQDNYEINSTQVNGVRVGSYSDKTRLVVELAGIDPLPFETVKNNKMLEIKVQGVPKTGSSKINEPLANSTISDEELMAAPATKQEPAQATPNNKVATAQKTDSAKKQKQVEAAPLEQDEPVTTDEDVETMPKKVAKNDNTIGAKAFELQVQTIKPKTYAQETKVYSGRKISLDFKDADIDSVLRLIAEVSNLNIVTDEEVGGLISIRLINVPWDQALDVILQSKQLGLKKMGNIVRIAPLDKLTKEDEQKLKAMENQEQLLPLYIRVVPVNYAEADKLAARIQPLLSPRGKIDTDSRTNVLIIKDIERNIDDAVALVRSLDSATPQVLIEAKIVEANTTFTRDLGVQWGGGYRSGPEFGNTLLPVRGSVAGSSAGNVAYQPNSPNFAVDLPAAVGTGAGGALGFLFGSLNNSMVLDLRLSALEQSGEGRVISSPRITTLDNEKAEILQGISIPFQTVSAQGTQTQFVDAALKLEVTPHITPDRSVLLDFKISKNAPDQTFTGGGGVPSISKKEAKSRMLVSDGDTAVVGGIFTIDRGSSMSGVPFINKVPVLGWFFKKKTKRDTKTELLLFVTPRIIQQ